MSVAQAFRTPVRRASVMAAGLAVWSPSTAAAQESDKVEEPIQELFVGELAYPQDAAELQLTDDVRFSGAAGQYRGSIALMAELGLTDRLQIAAELPVSSVPVRGERAIGAGNVVVETLYNPLSRRDLGLALSIGFEASIPALSRAGDDSWELEPVAILYKTLGPVHANLAVGSEVELSANAGELEQLSPTGALGVFLPLGPWVPALELGVEPGQSPAITLAAGLLWQPVDGVELGAAAWLGLDAPSFGVIVKSTIELGGQPEQEGEGAE